MMGRVSKMTAERMLEEMAEQLLISCRVVRRAVANLDDALPGFPSSASGAAPSSGAVMVDRDEVRLLPVERMATTPDPARLDLARLDRLIVGLRPQVNELYSLINRWGYDRHQGVLDVEEDHEWCESCIRLQRCEPRHRGKLCRWCGDFLAAEGRRPSVDLLDAHHRGVRITSRMITDDHPARKTAKTGKRKRSAA
jgi:hypothetical protein